MCLHIAHRLKALLGTKLVFFNLSLISASWFYLAEVFRNDNFVACSTALRSATETNEIGGYVTVPFSSQMTQHSCRADWPKFW